MGKSETRDQQKSFYEDFWQAQVEIACDEKCRLRFILGELRRLIKSFSGQEATAPETQRAQAGSTSPQAKAARPRIADVGCGRGWLTQLLSRFGEVTGFDRSVTEAKKRYPSINFVECDILEIPPDDFDVAVCSEVIEHVRKEDQPKLIETLFSILRPGGALILTTPNAPRSSQIVNALSLQEKLQPIEDWLDADSLKRLVARRFDVEKIVTVMFFPIAFKKIGPVSRIYRAVYEQMGTYRVLDTVLQRTRCGFYICLAGTRKDANA